jgi:HlyD family secretion protein
MGQLRWIVRWIVLGLALVAVAGGSLLCWRSGREPAYVTVPVAKSDLVRSIVTTGSVNPVVTVQVGTYVSGPIQTISCDFNTEVEAGQLCAKIDPRPYQEALDQAKANLASAEAQLRKDRATLAYAKINYERDRGLLETGVVSQDTVDSDRSVYEQALSQVHLDQAEIEQRRAALAAAQVNLDYTNIVSPVKGTVVSRNVDVGQTVAASFQTPTLFLIAQDLTKMQVDTNVSESDIGLARVGQRATFSVEAHPQREFVGTVVQVRRAPITVQNVVTYDVVIGVDNPEHLLFPGMTANARIIVEERKGVLAVPTRALRFEPGGVGAAAAREPARAEGPEVFVLRDGQATRVPVTLGLDDGTQVEVTGGSLAAGDAVIVGSESGDGAGGSAPSRSPFRF